MFYFLHLHKCAGTTFVDLARDNNVALFEPNKNGNPLNPLTGKRFRFWEWAEREQRHFLSSTRYAFVANEHELGRDHEFYNGTTYVVILRDPIDRMLSHFEWRHRDKLDHTRPANVRARAFIEYIEEHKSVWWAENYFVHALTYSANPMLGTNLLSLAKARLQNFDHIFFVDRFSEDMPAMKRYGWNLDQRQRKSFGPEGSSRTDMRDALANFREVFQSIMRRNEEDLELYEFARRLVANRVPETSRASREFSISRDERPASASFEFNVFCAHEAFRFNRPDDSEKLLERALQCAIPDDVEGIDPGRFVKTALKRFDNPAPAVVRPARKAIKEQRQTEKSAERAAKKARKLEKEAKEAKRKENPKKSER